MVRDDRAGGVDQDALRLGSATINANFIDHRSWPREFRARTRMVRTIA
jgi:hypothetical protein